jgi:outer membrane protein assembly factor BamB
MNRIISTLLTTTLMGTSVYAARPDWLQWRGPTRDSQIHESAKAWPGKLTEGNLKKKWSVGLAEGYSSPIVSGNRVITVETKSKKSEIVRAFDRDSGKQLWESSWTGSMKVPFFAAKNGSWVRSSPAADSKNIYIGGMLDVLVALDITTGKEKWSVDFPKKEKTTKPQFGFVCSPLLDKDSIYVQVGSALRKIRKDNGETMWKSLSDERAMFGSAFSSPVRARIGKRDQIVVQTRMELAGIAPHDGKVIWKTPVKAFRGMNILTPTVIDDKVFTSTYGGGTFWYGVETKGNKQDISSLWQHKVEGYMSSPVAVDGLIYMHGRDKRFHCIDPVKKEVLWSTGEVFGDYWSMVANGKQILALDSRGYLLLINASPEGFKPAGKIEVSGRATWAHLVVCGNEVYIRDLKGLTAYSWK